MLVVAHCPQVLVPPGAESEDARVAWLFLHKLRLCPHECCPQKLSLVLGLQKANDYTLGRDIDYLFQDCAGLMFSGIPQVKHPNHQNILPFVCFSKQRL